MSHGSVSSVGPRGAAALVAAASGASVAALGGLVVAGWLTVAVAIIQVLPGIPPMQYNTALGFMICGAALLAATLDLRRPTGLLGSLAAMIGLATQFEYLVHTDFGIDDLLVETYILTGVSDPGRMAPNSALALSLIGLALLGLSRRPKASVWDVWPALLGSIVVAIGTAALVGYAAGIPGAYCWGNFNAWRFIPQLALPCWRGHRRPGVESGPAEHRGRPGVAAGSRLSGRIDRHIVYVVRLGFLSSSGWSSCRSRSVQENRAS